MKKTDCFILISLILFINVITICAQDFDFHSLANKGQMKIIYTPEGIVELSSYLSNLVSIPSGLPMNSYSSVEQLIESLQGKMKLGLAYLEFDFREKVIRYMLADQKFGSPTKDDATISSDKWDLIIPLLRSSVKLGGCRQCGSMSFYPEITSSPQGEFLGKKSLLLRWKKERPELFKLMKKHKESEVE